MEGQRRQLRFGPHLRPLVRAYLLAKQRVIASGFEDEIAWQETVSIHDVTARMFLREAAWVVLCSGMRESVVRARFEKLECAFERWDPKKVAHHGGRCRWRAQSVFNHITKLDSIVRIAIEVDAVGVARMIHGIQSNGPRFLTRLPYIGPVTCFHLAKNLGFPVAKPDRHLERLATALGYLGAMDLCTTIAQALGEPVQVVDIVMWRFATINRRYVSWMEKATEQGRWGQWSAQCHLAFPS